MTTSRSLIWTTRPPSQRDLRKQGYSVVTFRDVRRDHIEPVRRVTAQRVSMDNAAESMLRLLDQNPMLAVLRVPASTAGDMADIYSFLVEPAFRRDVALLLGVDRSLDSIDAETLIQPGFDYPWSFERLKFITERYQRTPRDDGLPPLTPIEDQLLRAMRSADLTPEVQYGIGKFRVDFAFPAVRLAVEADGRAWHDVDRDASRDARLNKVGWTVVRFPGSLIYRAVDSCVEKITAAIDDRSSTVMTYSVLEDDGDRRVWWRRLLDWLMRRNQTPDPLEEPLEPIQRPVPEWKSQLDGNQRRAVDANEGVVQIIAPAGSGKTTTMIARVQELLSRGVPANRILCTTFNRATKNDLGERLNRLGISGADVKSFHGLGYEILKKEERLRAEVGQISYGQWRYAAKQAMDSLDGGVWFDAPVAAELVSDYKLAKMWDPAQARQKATDPLEETAAEIYRLYEQHLEDSDLNDFDDLVLRSVQLLQGDVDVRGRWQDRWETVLVDEYQDIEPAQELLIQLVSAPEDSIFVVGDEDQCIYSWRRASVERIVMLDTVYPGLERVVLDTSYRCPPRITEAARALIANNTRRFPKDINASPTADLEGEVDVITTESLSEGAKRVADILREVDGTQEIVVLARTTRLLREVVKACTTANISFRAPEKALRATDAEETVLAYLRLAASPAGADPVDVGRSFGVPNRYLMRGAERDVARHLRTQRNFESVVGQLRIPSGEEWRKKGISEWANLLSSISALSAQAAIRKLRTAGGLDKHYSSVEKMSRHDQVEVEALDELEKATEDKDLAKLVTVLENRAARLTNANDKEGTELATIHGAKGREWNTVILFGANADQLPHFRGLAETEGEEQFEEAIEDERRLAYVAITRTKQKLIVVTNGSASPFLREAGIWEAAAPLPTKASVERRKAASRRGRGA